MTEEKIEQQQQLSPWQKKPQFNAKTVMLISFGFFASSAAWSIYNTNVNRALNDLISNLAIVGFLMTLDNIIGVIIQPLIGSLSDKTKSRFGRRMPFIMMFLPVSAISFIFIPLVKTDLALLLVVMLIFNFSMALWRSPTVALMPDFVAPPDRSKGNGIVNFLGGIGAVFAFALGGTLIKVNQFLGFLVTAIVMFAALGVLLLGVKEPDTRNWNFTDERTKEKISVFKRFKEVVKENEKSTLFILFAIFAWFVGYQGLESLWSIYAGDFFAMDEGDATFMLTFVALPFMVFDIPAGYLGKKITRKKTIMIGLILGATMLFIGNWIKGAGNTSVMYIIFILFGISWALININSIAIVWELAPSAKHIGTYTGLYYFFSFLAAIIGPTIVGTLMEYVVGAGNMFILCCAAFIAAFLLMFKVKRGEASLTEEEKAAKKQAIVEADRE